MDQETRYYWSGGKRIFVWCYNRSKEKQAVRNFLIRHFPIILLIVLSVWAGKGLFKYSIFSTHDGNHHIARSFDVVQTLKEGHFPLRWAGTLNYGCGVPIFNFFYPLIYYLVYFVNLFDPDVIHNLKIIDFSTFFIGAIFFYLWIKQETKDKWSALASSILYLYAPYRFLLVFVRGSPEFMAYAILPIVLYFYSLVFEAKTKQRFIVFSALAALFGGLLTISHNFTVMFLMPLILVYLIIKILKSKGLSIKRLLVILFSFISAFGYGAFFIFPAILEEKFTQISTPRFLYIDHFPSLEQLLRSKWDYFYSAIGTELDGMSFQLGYAHWAVVVLAASWVIYTVINSLRKKEISKKFLLDNIWVGLFLVSSVATIYLMLKESTPIWEVLPILQKIQFPWRLLGVAVFTISALFPFWLIRVKNRAVYWAMIIFIPLLAIVGNRNHLLPQPVIPNEAKLYEDFEKLHYHRFTTTTFADDIIAPSAKGSCWFETPLVSTEKEVIEHKIVERGSSRGFVKFDVPNPVIGKRLLLGLGYYPEIFKIQVNGKDIVYGDCEGRVCFDIKETQAGPNTVSWQVVQTGIQDIFNKVTVLFAALWVCILFYFLKPGLFTKKNFVLFTIFAVFCFFRFYNLHDRIGFGWDQERDANAVKDILKLDLKLIGPRVLGDHGFFLPPYFFYVLAPFYKLSGGSPTAIVSFIVAYNLAFFVIAYKIFKKLFNTKFALLFLAFWAANPSALSSDTIAWNPIFVPLIFILLIYFSNISGFISGLLLGLGASSHVQVLLTLPYFLALKKITKRFLIRGSIGFLITFAPLFIFDLRNNFINSRLLINFFTNRAGERDYLAFFDVWNNFASATFGTPKILALSIALYLAVFALLFRKRSENLWRGLLFTWGLFPVVFMLYGTRPSEYYMNYLLVIIGMVFASLFQNLKTQFLLVAAALLILFGHISPDQLRDSNFGYYKKERAVNFLEKITKNSTPFNISFDLGYEGDAGFRYLIDYHGIFVDSSADLIQISAPPTIKSKFRVEGIGIEPAPIWILQNWGQIRP